jgi:hypothetical protein
VPRIRTSAITACTLILAAGLGGCAPQLSGLTEAGESGWFSRPMNLFSKPEWAHLSNANGDAISVGPVAQSDLVGPDGQCGAASAEAQAAVPASTPAPAAGAGFQGGLEGGRGGASAPVGAGGGIALGMTECQAVRRAGTPSHVAITAGEGGARRVVITYLTGAWPGIYTFESGRLKVVDAAPVQERKPEPKKHRPAKRAKTASAPMQVH